mgnify:CR=1 FL=1
MFMEFRPIACCHVVYKLILKVLCNRMGKILRHLINETQSAYVAGRDIVENIMICQELVRKYNRKTCSPRVIMKIDLRKAYDSVEWVFVEGMLKALEFPEKFI